MCVILVNVKCECFYCKNTEQCSKQKRTDTGQKKKKNLSKVK